MELLVRYGEALGAERLVETKNAATVTTVTNPVVRKVAMEHGMDGVFSRFNLDSDEIVETPQFEASTCQLIHGIYRDEAREFGVRRGSHSPACAERVVLRAARRPDAVDLHARIRSATCPFKASIARGWNPRR